MAQKPLFPSLDQAHKKLAQTQTSAFLLIVNNVSLGKDGTISQEDFDKIKARFLEQ